MSSFCWSISWAYRRTVIVPANSNLVPSGLGLRPERMLVFRVIFFPSLFSFYFPPSFLFLFPFLPFLVYSFFLAVRIYHGCVPGTISLQVIRDGSPQLVSTDRSLAYWYSGARIVLYFFRLLPSTRFSFCSLFGGHGRDFREMSKCWNIIITILKILHNLITAG